MEYSSSHRRKGQSLRYPSVVLLLTGAMSIASIAAPPGEPEDVFNDKVAGPVAGPPAEDQPATEPPNSSNAPPEQQPPLKLPDDASKPAEKPIDAATLRNWFNDLSHRDAAVREEARVRLMSMGRRNLEAFQKIVEENRPLAPSQASALRQIVNNVYLSGDTYETNGVGGFLGIRMQEVIVGTGEPARVPPDVRPAKGVVIVERMPGFCGARMLLDGDVILNIAEHPVRTLDPDTFVSIVAREMHAGQTIHFELIRQGQVMRVPVTLDPRPDAAEQQSIQEFLNQRADKFDAYWDKSFRPLVEEGVG